MTVTGLKGFIKVGYGKDVFITVGAKACNMNSQKSVICIHKLKQYNRENALVVKIL